MLNACTFSPCRQYRYTLWHEWSSGRGYCQFVGLNPSTADEQQLDPTVRRCVQYAKDWGYRALCMTNIFAYRATDPRDMKAQADPVGPDNDRWLMSVSQDAGIVIAAWGTHGTHLNRAREVFRLLPRLHALKVTKHGHPSHPLYLRRDARPVLYSPLEAA
ncbi:DUF1643 domain-containing protein [Algiphilus sp.]|uniref:DUF1643 domain-containing protein n=1 Tax=Algiphilus sp. TaxID=1872431 RepID=UPI003CCC040A